MKRFLKIFGICFASLMVFIGGYIGVRYLIGDFDPEVILPENISFELPEYYFDDGDPYTLTVFTTTENVTETELSLQLSKNCKETIDKKHWTDGIIIIPKVAEIGEPFEIRLVRDNTYANEVDDGSLNSWIKGGISNIIATSQNKLISTASTKIYVDVPVLKTEVVIFNKNLETSLVFDEAFKNIEFSENLTSSLNDDANIPNIRAGESFYVGIKHYPSASAIKYSKISSTNLLLAFKNEILEALEDNNIAEADYFEELNALISGENEVRFNDIIDEYSKLVTISGDNENLNNLYASLIAKFEDALKYNNITEKISENKKVNFGEKVPGTNLYKLTATQNLGNADFLLYTFKESGEEDITLNTLEPGQDVLPVLETLSQSGKVVKTTSSLNVVNVEVDTMLLSGGISDLYTNLSHTIYASKYGINNKTNSYLKIALSNSNIKDVDLSDKIVNVGIRFEKKSGIRWVDASSNILFVNSNNLQTITLNDEVYYLPFGDANYWNIYAPAYTSDEYRAVVKYFIATEDPNEPYVIIDVLEDDYPRFTLIETSTATENMVSWKNVEPVDLKVIYMENVLDKNGNMVASVSKNEEYNLASNVNQESLQQNIYTSVRYFIYSDNLEILSDYFDVKNVDAVEYTFNDGSVKNLYELSSSILKLKSKDAIPSNTVHAIFVTIKTDINGAPIMTAGNKYEIIKYSAVKSNQLEKLSDLQFEFTKSVVNLSGTMTIKNDSLAGVVDEKILVSQNVSEIMFVEVVCDPASLVTFQTAVSKGEVSVVAKNAVSATENYINLSNAIQTAGKVAFDVSTKQISADADVYMFIVYTISGEQYLFPLNLFDDDKDPLTTAVEFGTLKIVANINSNAKFNFVSGGEEIATKDIKNIEIETAYLEGEDKIVQNYLVNFKDELALPQLNVDATDLFDSGILKVSVKNFLGKDGTDDWYLVSNNPGVAQVLNDNKTIEFNESGEAIISLYLNGVGEVQDQIVFSVKNDGYVSKYATKDDNSGNRAYTFSEANKYVNSTIVLSVKGSLNNQIILTDTQIAIENNTALFAMWYNLSNKDIKLNFSVYLEDDESLEKYKAITSGNDSKTDLLLGNSFTIAKSIGSDVVLHLVYVCQQPLITQRVTLTVSKIVSVEKFEIEGNGVQNVSAEEFTVYAGYGYTFKSQITGGDDAYYFIQNSGLTIIKNDSLLVKLIEGKFYFDDVKETTSYDIYISNKNSDIGLGDLQHKITINVKPNIKIKDSIKNSGYQYVVNLGTDGKATVEFEDIFEREIQDSINFISTEFNIQKGVVGVAIYGGELMFTYSSIENYTEAAITLSYYGYSLHYIIFKVVPHCYENASATRIALYNREKAIILVNNDMVTNGMPDIVLDEFDNSCDKVINNESAFAAYISENKITGYANNLFTNTGCYLLIKDDAQNTTKYRIIISQLQYPFIDFQSAKIDNKELDVYELFVNLSGENLFNYYEENEISIGSRHVGGDAFNLVKESASDPNESIFKFVKDAKISFGVSLIGENVEPSTYVVVNGNTIETYAVGKDYIVVQVILRFANGSYRYNIPAVVKVYQSQKLEINYPNDGRALDEDYGTDVYDSNNMLKPTEIFGNKPMEYISFNVGGKASLNFNDGSTRFVVKKLDGATFVEDVAYSAGFNYNIEKVFAKLDGVWAEVNKENIASFANISKGILNINKNGCTAVRVKVLVSTNYGSAQNFYYIQSDEVFVPTLYKMYNGKEQQISYKDTIDANAGESVSIDVNNPATYKYYLKENLNQLKIRVINSNGVVISKDTTFVVPRSANGEAYQIVLYTLYGDLATVTVNIGAHYQASLKDNTYVYSGTKLGILDFVEIKDIQGNNITNVKLIEGNIECNNYDIITDGANSYIKFNHSKTEYVIESFVALVKIDDNYEFLVKIENLNVKIGVESALNANDYRTFDSQIENNGKIQIEATDWEALFKFNSPNYNNYYDLTYRVIYGNEQIQITKGNNIEIPIGVLIGETLINLEFQAVATGFKELIIISSNVRIPVKPAFTAKINYPQGTTSSFVCEYVEVGSEVDFSGENFNKVKRIDLVNTQTGVSASGYKLNVNKRDGSDLGEITDKYTFNSIGNYEIQISLNNIVYGRYYVEVKDSCPIAIDTNSSINGQTFYAGYGTNNIFNYVDIVFDIPTDMGGLENAQMFDIGYFEAGTFKVIKEKMFYNSAEVERTYRFAITLDEYSQAKDLNVNNLYVKYEKQSGDITIICQNVSITPRYTITYNGDVVDIEYYKNIIKIDSVGFTIEQDEVDANKSNYTYELALVPDIISKARETTITGKFNVKCDIQLTKEEGEFNLELNANEYLEGISFVDTFKVKDSFGKKFWYNNVGKFDFSDVELKLTYVSSTTPDAREHEILLEPRTIEKDGVGSFIYDYNLKAMGAAYEGTIVTLKLEYKVTNDNIFTETILIKVNSDIEFSVRNGDGYETPNSESNPKVLKVKGKTILASASQTSFGQDEYCIYAYGKYDSTKRNFAQTMIKGGSKKAMVGGTEVTYASWKLENNNLVFNFETIPQFGDKIITLKFVDNFGFTFNYYITLCAQTRISSYQVTQELYYEGESIYIYNKQGDKTIPNTGVALNLIDANNDTDKSAVIIKGCELKINNKPVANKEDIITIGDASSYYEIGFKYQSQSFWQQGNGLTVTMTLIITIGLEGGNETADVIVTVVLHRRYETSIKEENTYVRDNVEFDAEHLVSVYDYKLGSYLGEATMDEAQAIKLSFALDSNFAVSGEYYYSYKTAAEETKQQKIEFVNLRLYDLMLARMIEIDDDRKDEYEQLKSGGFMNFVSGELTIFNDEIVDEILGEFNITYSGSEDADFTLQISAKAINTETKESSSAEITTNLVYDEDATVFVTNINSNYIYLGKHKNPFIDEGITKENYEFEIYQLEDYFNSTMKLVAKTQDENYTPTETMITKVEATKPITEFKNVKYLQVSSAQANVILLKKTIIASGNETLIAHQIAAGINQDYLELNDYVENGIQIEIYTGLCYYNGTLNEYSLSNNGGLAKMCVNGFTQDNALIAKNISEMYLKGNGNDLNKLSLSDNGEFSIDEKFGIDYQSLSARLEVILNTDVDDDENDITYISEEIIRVTLLYTSIDASNALVGPSTMHVVELNYAGDPNVELTGSIAVQLNDWSDGYMLVPGIGVNALIAKYKGEDLKVNQNYSNLSFEIASISSDGNKLANDLVEINTSGKLTLKAGFIISSYYVTINIKCKYAGESRTIGIAQIAFTTNQ